MSKPST